MVEQIEQQVKKSKSKIWIILGVVLLVLIVILVIYFIVSSSQQSGASSSNNPNQNQQSPQTKTFLYTGYSSSQSPETGLEAAISSKS